MISDITINYTLNYKVSIDAIKMEQHYQNLVDEHGDDEVSFEQWAQDVVLVSLKDWEDDKLHDRPLPPYITHFSVNERFVTTLPDDGISSRSNRWTRGG